MMTELGKIELKEYPIPEIGDGDILVKVEGCGICGTDAHEYKKDPFSLIPVVLGHEGTGELPSVLRSPISFVLRLLLQYVQFPWF